MKKKVVLDTNVLLDTPDIIFEHDNIVFPVTVLNELDNHKTNPNIGYMARQAIRTIRKYMADESKTYYFDEMKDPNMSPDMNIINSARRHSATLYTKDIAMSFISKSYSVETVVMDDFDNLDYDPYINDKYSTYNYPSNINFDEPETCVIAGEELEEFKQYLRKKHNRVLKPWTFIIQNSENVWCYNPYMDLVENIGVQEETKKFTVDVPAGVTFKPKDIYQQMAVYSIINSPATFISGKFGSGKSVLGLATALYMSNPRAVYIIRPTLKRKAYETGFLPGDKDEKMEEYISGFLSALYFLYGNTSSNKNGGTTEKNGKGMDYVKDVILPSKCEILTMNMLHGLSLQKDDIIICDESQFLDTTSLQLLLTRIGDGAKLIMLGDADNQTYDLIKKSETGIYSLMKNMPHKALSYVKLQETYRNKELTALAEKLTE